MGRRAWKCRTPKSRPRDFLCVWESGGASLLITHSPGPALLVSPCAGCSCPYSSGVEMRPPLFTAWTDSWLPQAHSFFPRVQPGLPAHYSMGLDSDPDSLRRARSAGAWDPCGQRSLPLSESSAPHRPALSKDWAISESRGSAGLFPRSSSCRRGTSAFRSRKCGGPFSF